MSFLNPYQSPRSFAPPGYLPVLPERRWDEVDVRVLTVRGWWNRYLTLTGSINADLEYRAVGNGEQVFVNDRLIARTSPFYWQNVAPRIDFHLELNHLDYVVPARIDVKASFLRLLMVSAFRLAIAGKIIYGE